jgi:hypothetical protein
LYFIASFPLRYATRFATIIRAQRRAHGVPLVLTKIRKPVRASHDTHGLGDRCAGNQPALLVKISVRFKPARQGWMHDLRQCHCPIITPTLLCLKFADVFESSLVALSIGVQNYRKK